MRWIFFSLIFFNFVYFSWKHLPKERAYTAGEVGSAESIAGKQLVLLKEMLPAEGSTVPPPSIDVSRRFVAFEAGSQLEMGSQSAIDEVLPSQVEKEGVKEGSESSPTSLRMPVIERVCAHIGPFASEAEAVELLVGLEGWLLRSAVSSKRMVVAKDNWVLIPPLASRKDALKMLKKLQQSKIDSYLVADGKYRNAISLGLFKKASSAQRIMGSMVSAGYQVEIQVLDRLEDRYWLTVLGEAESGKAEQMLMQLIDDREKIKTSESFCEMFASAP